MKGTMFFRQAELLLSVLPSLDEEPRLALKGGTAINFFVQNLPRLSIDIDLAYLPVSDRETALRDISETLARVAAKLRRRFPDMSLTSKREPHTDAMVGLIAHHESVAIKIEPNLVIRGSVYPPVQATLCDKAQELFERTLTSHMLSTGDIYGGKMCAALDRQHPRDLFDIWILLKTGGITDEIRKAFIVYLISHPRPMIELLNPRLKDLSRLFDVEFKGMSIPASTVEDLVRARDELIQFVGNSLSTRERQFLLSVKQIQPDWQLLALDDVEMLPAVRWKLLNLERMDTAKHHRAVEMLRSFLRL